VKAQQEKDHIERMRTNIKIMELRHQLAAQRELIAKLTRRLTAVEGKLEQVERFASMNGALIDYEVES
jgi:uncharacterized coiled-coil protein SlyX